VSMTVDSGGAIGAFSVWRCYLLDQLFVVCARRRCTKKAAYGGTSDFILLRTDQVCEMRAPQLAARDVVAKTDRRPRTLTRRSRRGS
jgi:hypothetical protein